MATLFGNDTAGSIFAARKAMKKAPEAEQKAQQSKPKHQKPKDICIYQTTAIVQTVNQAANATNNVGNCAIGIFRNANDFLFKIMDSKRTLISTIPINNETHWKYNNSKQCVTLDQKLGQIILDFPNELATQIFSIFAVLTKAQQYNGIFPIKIEGPAQNQSSPIHYLSIDTTAQAISPLEEKNDFIPPQDTNQADFANSNSTGSAGVCRIQNGIFAFIQVLQKVELQDEPQEAVGDEEEEIIYEEEIVYEDEPEIDSSKILSLQEEVTQKLNSLALILKSLRPNPIQHGKLTVSNVALLHDVKCAITASKQKDEIIEKLQSQIDKYGDTLTQIREKEEMKKMINKLNADIKNFKELEDESENIQRRKRETIENLTQEIKNYKANLTKTDEELLIGEFANIKKIRTQMEAQLKKEAQNRIDNEDTIKILQEQVIDLTKQNDELKQKIELTKQNEQQIEISKKEITGKLKEYVQAFCFNTFQLVSSNLKEDGKYNGSMVKGALQTILQRVNNKLLGIEQEEDEDEEEEEEANEEANEEEGQNEVEEQNQ